MNRLHKIQYAYTTTYKGIIQEYICSYWFIWFRLSNITYAIVAKTWNVLLSLYDCTYLRNLIRKSKSLVKTMWIMVVIHFDKLTMFAFICKQHKIVGRYTNLIGLFYALVKFLLKWTQSSMRNQASYWNDYFKLPCLL